MLKYCSNCQSENDSKSKKCVVCGKEFPNKEELNTISENHNRQPAINLQKIIGIIIAILGICSLFSSLINSSNISVLNIVASLLLFGIGVSVYGIGQIVSILRNIEFNTQDTTKDKIQADRLE